MPKSAVDVRKHEIDRALRVINDKTIQICGFSLKNKQDTFQPILYPPHPSNVPSSNVKEWEEGIDKPPNMQTFTEEDWNEQESGTVKKIKLESASELKAKNAQLEEELKKAHEHIAALEAEIAELKK